MIIKETILISNHLPAYELFSALETKGNISDGICIDSFPTDPPKQPSKGVFDIDKKRMVSQPDTVSEKSNSNQFMADNLLSFPPKSAQEE